MVQTGFFPRIRHLHRGRQFERWFLHMELAVAAPAAASSALSGRISRSPQERIVRRAFTDSPSGPARLQWFASLNCHLFNWCQIEDFALHTIRLLLMFVISMLHEITKGMPCTQCAHSAKFWMSANTPTLVLAPFHKFLVPY